ncbi:MAG: hypothetical protein HZA17_12550 [Nitrospirae bacterium]|nr:hypothetical protein [Nitrospirota bacterium]
MPSGEAGEKRFLLPALIGLSFFAVYFRLFSCEKVFTSDSIIWYGSFHYFVDSVVSGHFPFWDPYLTTGTYFYPNVPHHGLLDPVVLPGILAAKTFDLSPLTLYIYLHITRLVLNVAGAYFLFRHMTKNRPAAVLSAGVLLFALPHSYFKQYGVLDHFYLTPYALWLLLLLFENPSGRRRYLYISGLVFITGITINIYIPVQYLFNLLFFTAGILLFRIARVREVIGEFRDRRLLIFSGLALAVTVMMTAPPFALMYKDASQDGELFPMQRIIQKNDAIFKQIMASEVNTSNLSNKFTGNLAVFNSWGNVVNLLYPDLLHSFRYWAIEDMMSEIDQYIGIIPLLFCIIGFIYFKSRYKYLILLMLALNFINGFSSYGFMNKPFNGVQEILNTIFPPLQMSQGRETFGYFVILYLCAFMSMGITVFFEQADLLKARYRSMVVICAVFILAKAWISWHYLERLFFISSYDLFVMLQILFFAVMAYISARRKVLSRIVFGAMAFVIIADLCIYNYIFRDDVLQDSSPFYHAFAASATPEGEFQYFREPVVTLPLGGRYISFEESISRVKGALSLGYNHSLFTTKRYYDLLTHVPLQNQLFLSGVVYPVIRFFPMDRVVTVPDKKQLMEFFVSGDLSGEDRIFIEAPGIRKKQTLDLGNLQQYPNVEWLKLENLFPMISAAMERYEGVIKGVRENPDRYFNNPLYAIEVKDFSVNEINISVKNREEGYLYYNDGWSRYWEAYDNDRKVPVSIANYNFKAVFLERGEHLVRFVFNPVHNKIGLFLYYAGLLLSAALIVVSYIRQPKLLKDDGVKEAE